MGADRDPAAHLEMDVRPGGVWRGLLRSPGDGSELSHKGVFREVTPPERLVFTFSWDEEGERGLETLITITFADQGDKTLMTFRQIPFQSAEERDGHRYGWGSAFDRFDEHLIEPRGELSDDHRPEVVGSGSRTDPHSHFRRPAQPRLQGVDRSGASREMVGTEELHQPGLRIRCPAGRKNPHRHAGPNGTVYPMTGAVLRS